jgi:hypothetical protein
MQLNNMLDCLHIQGLRLVMTQAVLLLLPPGAG